MSPTPQLEIDIAASRDRVWRALTEPRELEQWMCEHADVSLADGRYAFWGKYTPSAPGREDARQNIVEVDEGRRLRFSWSLRGADTTVDITLEGDTTVRVVHTDIPPPDSDVSSQGPHWQDSLGHLREYLEMGRTSTRFDYTWPHVGGYAVHVDMAVAREVVWRALFDGWRSPSNPRVRPARNADEDFAFDVGAIAGIKILDVDEPARFSMHWTGDDGPSVIEYTLTETSRGTRITMVHSGFDDVDVQGLAQGFFSGLPQLAWRLETNGRWPPPAREGANFLGVRTVEVG